MTIPNRIDELLSHWLLAAAMILTAATLTIPQIDRLALGWDEEIQYQQSFGIMKEYYTEEHYTASDVLATVTHRSLNQVPLGHLLLHFWGHVAGHSLVGARLLFIFAGLMSLAAIYRLAHDFTTPIAASFAVFAVLCSAFYFMYWPQIRYYPLVALFATLMLWLYLRICDTRRQPPLHNYLALVLAGGALLMTHGFSFVFIMAIALYHLLVRKKNRRWLQVVAAGFVALALLSPLLYRMATVAVDYSWRAKAGRADRLGDILSTWISVFSNGSPLFFALVVMAAIIGWRRGYLRGNPFLLLMPLFIIAIVLASEMAGFLNVTHMRYFLVGMPILSVFYASGFYALYRLRRALALLMALLWLGTGLHYAATADWQSLTPERFASHSNAPWHLVSRHMRQADDHLQALAVALNMKLLDRGKNKNGYANGVLRELYFGQYDLEVQNINENTARGIDAQISGRALERSGYWILFQHGVPPPRADQRHRHRVAGKARLYGLRKSDIPE